MAGLLGYCPPYTPPSMLEDSMIEILKLFWPFIFSSLSPGHQHFPVAITGRCEVGQERLHESGRVGAAGGIHQVPGVQHRNQ